MKSIAVAAPVPSTNLVVDEEDVAARCAATTLITASTATDVECLARRIHAAQFSFRAFVRNKLRRSHCLSSRVPSWRPAPA